MLEPAQCLDGPHGSAHVIMPAGNPQPAYRYDAMKIMMEFPKPKNGEAMADQGGERKQVGHRLRATIRDGCFSFSSHLSLAFGQPCSGACRFGVCVGLPDLSRRGLQWLHLVCLPGAVC